MLIKLQCQISKVVLKKQQSTFIIIQCKFNHGYSEKYRTDIVINSFRPIFKNNIFTFKTNIQPEQEIKFVLMKIQNNQSLEKASMKGTASLKLTEQRLKQLPNAGEYKTITFMNLKEEIAQFQLHVKLLKNHSQSINSNTILFRPLISRVLFDENCKDSHKANKNRNHLREQLDILYEQFHQSKKQQSSLQELYLELEIDQQELKDQINTLDQINSCITEKMLEKENKDGIQMEINLLQHTQEGRQLLAEKIFYLQKRIEQQKNQQNQLKSSYKAMAPNLQLKQAQAQKYQDQLKGKTAQQFELDRNNQILQSFEDIQYKFKCNNQMIKMFTKMSENSHYTTKQAKFILEQVKHKIKMQNYESNIDLEQDRVLEEIEKSMKNEKNELSNNFDYSSRNSEERKLQSIEGQIAEIKEKIERICKKRNLWYQKKINLQKMKNITNQISEQQQRGIYLNKKWNKVSDKISYQSKERYKTEQMRKNSIRQTIIKIKRIENKKNLYLHILYKQIVKESLNLLKQEGQKNAELIFKIKNAQKQALSTMKSQEQQKIESSEAQDEQFSCNFARQVFSKMTNIDEQIQNTNIKMVKKSNQSLEELRKQNISSIKQMLQAEKNNSKSSISKLNQHINNQIDGLQNIIKSYKEARQASHDKINIMISSLSNDLNKVVIDEQKYGKITYDSLLKLIEDVCSELQVSQAK